MKRMLIVVCVCLMGVGMTGGMTQEKRQEIAEQLIEKKYDRFKDETTIKLKPQKLREIAKPREELSLSVEATHKGERLVRPKEVMLIFNSVSENYIYHDEADVFFIIDGKRIEAGAAYAKDDLLSPNLIKKTLTATVPLETFLAIANGKAVEMKLGRAELRLSDNVISALRAFSNAITGESKGG